MSQQDTQQQLVLLIDCYNKTQQYRLVPHTSNSEPPHTTHIGWRESERGCEHTRTSNAHNTHRQTHSVPMLSAIRTTHTNRRERERGCKYARTPHLTRGAARHVRPLSVNVRLATLDFLTQLATYSLGFVERWSAGELERSSFDGSIGLY